MKKLLLALSFTLLCGMTAFAQSARNAPRIGGDCPNFYLGLSTGLDNPSGLIGFNIDVPISDFSIGAGAGLSTRGWKTYLEGRYYFSPCNRGWAIGAGLTYSTGLKDFAPELPVYAVFNGSTIETNQKVLLDAEPQVNAYLAGYRFFNLGQRSRFYVGLGYSQRLKDEIYTLKQNVLLTDKAETTLKATAPGGVMVSLGFSFAL